MKLATFKIRIKTKRLFFLIIFIFFSNFTYASYLDYLYVNRDVSYNTLGQTGLIMTPSAETRGNSSLYFTATRNEIWKIGTLTATPFDWLEASYFYYRPSDIVWGGKAGLYLDKGFNVKFSYSPKKFNNKIAFAIGLDDFAGTGVFSKEYLATTYSGDNFKINLGIGFGMFASENSFKNPFSFIIPSFENRTNVDEFRADRDYGQGGTPLTSLWFKGDAALFGGIEYMVPYTKGLRLKVELDTLNYFDFSVPGPGKPPPTRDSFRWKDSKINYALTYPTKFGNVDISYIKGNTLNLSFSIGFNFGKNLVKKDKFSPVISSIQSEQNNELSFYRSLLTNLKNNNLYLQTADINDEQLSLSIESADIFNPINSLSRTAYIAKKVSEIENFDFDYINVSTIQLGTEVNKIKFPSDVLSLKKDKPLSIIIKDSEIINTEPLSYKSHKYRPKVLFPIYFNSIMPEIRSHVGSPQKFYYGGLGIVLNSEIQFNRNLFLTSKIGHSIYDNFDEKASQPASNLPHVRTEIVDYLNGAETYLSKLQLDYIWSPKRNMFAKLSGGIFEQMYGGYGAEFIYKPFHRNIAVGYEFYRVKRREYDQKFNFFDYKVQTDHINFAYYHPRSHILFKTSYGNYLAKDTGFTLDLSRRMPSGLQIGFFFSRTDVPADLFGEGSFDKGFYFNIPNNLFIKNQTRAFTSFGLKTLTRDGGQKLNIDNPLIDIFYKTNKTEISEGWNEFLY